MSLTMVTMHGTYVRQDDLTPASGTVTFTLAQTIKNSVDDVVVVPYAVVCTLDGSGHFTANMPALDDVGTSPTGVTYTVQERVEGSNRSFSLALSKTSVDVDMAIVSPGTPGVVNFVVLASDTTYDHTASGLAADDVQAAIDELAADVGLDMTLILRRANNLSDLADVTTARANLGLGTAAVEDAGVAGGVATLDGAGKLPTAQLPPLAINDTFVVTSQADMLALTAQRGDAAVRTDLSPAETFLLAADDPTILSNWVQITTVGAVVSVFGRTGAVVGTKTDVGLGNVDNTSDVNKPVSTAQGAADATTLATATGRASALALVLGG